MRAFVIAPADVDAHLFGGQIGQRVVQRLDMGVGDLDEVGVGKVGEQHVPRQRQIGAVELQVEPGGDDGFVFRLHGVGQRGQIGLARGIEIVLQKERDHAGRGGVHEPRPTPCSAIAALRLAMSFSSSP